MIKTLNTIKTVLQVAAILISGSLLAEDGLPNPSDRPDAQSRTVDLFAQALYWYTDETIEWAFTLSHSQNVTQSNYKTFTFDGAPGFRVGLGYNMEHDQWDTRASYTWFQSKARDDASGSVTSAFLAARLSLLEPYSTGEASLHLHYNIFDWDLGRGFLVSKHLFLRPLIGLKGGWIHQTLRSDWTILNFFGPHTFSASENIKHHFYGVGPKGGVTGKWCFGNIEEQCFSLIGRFETGYLWGHWSIQDEFIDNLDTVISVKTSDRNFGAFVLHAFFGFGWDCNFNCDQSHVSINFGYEIEDWFNHFQIYSDVSGSQNNDLILQGLNLSLRFDF